MLWRSRQRCCKSRRHTSARRCCHLRVSRRAGRRDSPPSACRRANAAAEPAATPRVMMAHFQMALLLTLCGMRSSYMH